MSSLQGSGRHKASAAVMFLGPTFPMLTTRKRGTPPGEHVYWEALER